MGLFWNKKADEQQGMSENAAAIEGADGMMPSQPGKATRLKGTLVARGLCKSYRGRQVVNGVSFGVRAGEAVGILGPNGAGKTTCFYMVTGLVPADAGAIEIDGYDVTSMPMYRRSRLGIGYLPQEASIFRGLSVENNIKAVLEVVEKTARSGRSSSMHFLKNFISHICARLPQSLFRVVNAVVWKSHVRWRLARISCCSTNPSLVLTRLPSRISSSSCVI